jgi:hypothetical protein
MLIIAIYAGVLALLTIGFYWIKKNLPTWFKGMLFASLGHLDKRYKTFYYDHSKLPIAEQLEANVDFVVISQFGIFVIKYKIGKDAGLCLVLTFHEDPSLGFEPKSTVIVNTNGVANYISSHRSLIIGEKDVNNLTSAILHEALPLAT